MGLRITTEICSRPGCGGNIVIDDDGREYCLLCSRPDEVNKRQDASRIGGLQTFLRHGREHMAEIGQRGGRPRLRQLPVLEAQFQIKGGRLPNRLSELKELYKLQQRSKPVNNENGGS